MAGLTPPHFGALLARWDEGIGPPPAQASASGGTSDEHRIHVTPRQRRGRRGAPARTGVLTDNLAADGYEVIAAGSVEQALWHLQTGGIDALLVDVGADAPALLDQIRRQTVPDLDPQLPILAIAGGDWLARTRLLERGADDVIDKPYSYPELRARLQALLRRAQARREPHVLRAGVLRRDTRSRQANVAGIQIGTLPGKEYRLLLTLLADPTRVLTKVNFVTRPEEGKGSEGFRGSGLGW